MEFLIHTDLLVDSILTSSAIGKKIIELSKRKELKLWTFPGNLITLREELIGKKITIDSRVQSWLDALVVLPITGNEIKATFTSDHEKSDCELVARIVKSFNLKGVLTLNPEFFTKQKINAWRPEMLPEILLPSCEPETVPLVYPPASYHEIWSDLEEGFARVIRNGNFILGDEVKELEEKIAAYCQTRYAVGVSSGTDALLVALLAEGIGAGDEILTTPYTFFATAGSIARTGAKPVFVDIEPETFNIDSSILEEKITSKTKAILPVHLYGQCADMDPILEISKRKRIAVIEDAAQAIGSEYKFKRAGSFGRYGCFSFFPTKNLGGVGDGGIVTTSSNEAAQKIKLLRVHGSKVKYEHDLLGGNFRLDTMQAAVVLVKMKYLEGWTERRRKHAERYRQLLNERRLLDRIQTPREIFPRHIYNQFVIRVPGCRNKLREYLKSCGIASAIYYPIPLHRQKCFASFAYNEKDFPESEKAAAETLALPISHDLTSDQQEKVVESIARFFA